MSFAPWPQCADAGLGDDFLILWVFDTEAYGSTYGISDDVDESMWIASAIADDDNPLTQAEVDAWTQVAARNHGIVVSEVYDLNRDADRHNYKGFRPNLNGTRGI